MFKKVARLLMVASAGIAVLAASPASASILYEFYNAQGQLIGSVFVDDRGVVCDRAGTTTGWVYTVTTYYGYYSCA
ncbi:MAG TPA: hypothetical protein VI168_16820 [Croceibacterium sp.]